MHFVLRIAPIFPALPTVITFKKIFDKPEPLIRMTMKKPSEKH
jgi:hypothetical protein